MTQDVSAYRDASPGFDGTAALNVPIPATERDASRPVVPQDFAMSLLAAMTEMAALSPRRQADVAVAMRRAGLRAPQGMVGEALEQLQRDGCVERPLALFDGGILVSVTMRGIERLASTSHRHVVAGMISGGLR